VRLPNVVAKVSGLTLPGVPFTADALRPAWDAALETFGPSRLMYGGDWPITVTAGGYQAAWAVYAELIGELSPAEQSAILHETAAKAYRLHRSERTSTEGS
jgi:L-fuconolactonase